VPALLEDLCEFLNSDMLPTVVQAAIAHAQFETIHPFADGNGRVGRALVHLVMRRRRLSQSIQPPVSLILAAHKGDYIAGLEGFRYEGTSESEKAYKGLNRWIATFASACTRAVKDAVGFEARCEEISRGWRATLGSVRSGSSVDLLLRALPGTPIISVKSAMALVGRSKPQVNEAVARLEKAGILKQVTVGRRNRTYEAPTIIDAFTDLERQLASPVGRHLS
jgi:Fic family protein